MTVTTNKLIKEYLSKIGTKGGKAKSEKKTAACKLNAQKPRKKRSKKIDAVNSIIAAKNNYLRFKE
jgi:hypothetical protein